MLFKRHVLEGIADGSIDRVFRRWEQPRARPGTRQRTAVGVIEVDSVEAVERDDLTDEDARRAGFGSRAELLKALASASGRRKRAQIHRVRLHYAGPDHRVELRNRSRLSAAERRELEDRLDAMDARSNHGPWTRQTLALIRHRPATLAAELAAEMGREKRSFKADVRKLKELGLTESLEKGYRLSPRGRAFLEG